MKNDIPQVLFQKQQADGLDFEILPLQELYQRDENLLGHSMACLLYTSPSPRDRG